MKFWPGPPTAEDIARMQQRAKEKQQEQQQGEGAKSADAGKAK